MKDRSKDSALKSESPLRAKATPTHTPGPWILELTQSWPFGVVVMAGEKEILKQDAYCHSSTQVTRADNESGLGFPYIAKGNSTTNHQAREAIAEQDANARLVAAAPELLELLIEIREELSPGVSGGNDYHDAWEVFGKRIEAAIAKAEGR